MTFIAGLRAPPAGLDAGVVAQHRSLPSIQRFHHDFATMRTTGCPGGTEMGSSAVRDKRRSLSRLPAMRGGSIISDIQGAAFRSRSLTAFLGYCLRRTRLVLQVDIAALLVLREERPRFRFFSCPAFGRAKGQGSLLEDPIASVVVQRGKPLVVADLTSRDSRLAHWGGIRALLCVPLLVKGNLVGVLGIGSSRLGLSLRDHQGILTAAAGCMAPFVGMELLEARLTHERARLRSLLQRNVRIEEADRRDLARELHDELGQQLIGLTLTLESGGKRSSGSSKGANTHVRAVGLARDLTDTVRRLVLRLRPAVLDDMGLVPALRWLVEDFRARVGTHVDFQPKGDSTTRMSSDIEIGVFRIVQESLTNVARHAAASSARLQLRVDRAHLRVSVKDNGVGFDPTAVKTDAAGGLEEIRERAMALGGKVTIDSNVGRGTTVTVEIPRVPAVAIRRQES
jgi:signal transduction histidine kinase